MTEESLGAYTLGSVWLGIVVLATGARFATFTVIVKDCVANAPFGSVAVAVIVGVPSATGVTVSVASDRLTVALLVSEEIAV